MDLEDVRQHQPSPGGLFAMTYRTKVLLLLMATVVVATGLSTGLLCWYFERVLRDQVGSQVLTMAATTAALMDGELHKAIKAPGDETSPPYITLRDQMRRARDANRRDDFMVRYLYTLTVSPEEQGLLRFAVDADEDPTKVSAVGEAYRTKLNNPFNVDQYQYDKVFTKDDWGEFLSANAPIKDREGKVVAALGVDVDANQVRARTASVMGVAFAGLGGALLIALGAAMLLARRVSQPLEHLRNTVEAIGKGDLTARTALNSHDEFGKVGAAINAMAEGLQERATLRSSFERYVPYKVVESILHSPNSPALIGERRKVTVLFSDLRGFSRIAENRRPEEVVTFLNACCEVMSEVIERHGGTLDKFVGDGMMATFGAPNDDPFQEEHAIMAALDLQEKMRALSESPASAPWPAIQLGIGINSGYAVVGSVGSSRHMEYTAIGETTNTANCLEAMTKELGVHILISQYTYNSVRGLFKVRQLGPVKMKGHSDEMAVYAVEGVRDDAAAPAGE
ncbi:MAG: adenylate cyclase [Chthoniobacter sp.]|jgi:adenylate cyclase|nr:adenylate cyclase [Chthoniobacter sp.]